MTTSPTTQDTDIVERNKRTMRRIYEEIIDRGRTDLIDKHFTPGLVNHTAPEALRNGTGAIVGLVSMLRTAFPDCRTEIEELTGAGDVVVMRNWYSGTHLGPFLGNAPTGRTFRFRQMHWMRFDADGRVTDHWGVRDDVSHLQQLGLIDEPPAG
ncbi:ester cyclase [Dactylosporangium sp. NPDC000555]|uniref:ester cyclase n=1 Tax=Dactylosporangium sp. NPDC000555 TaxID=3154260 RepID=UPI00331FFD77